MTSEVTGNYNINVAILGPVSAGKSTLMNSLFVSQYSDMKIKRTTMTPQIYEEQPYSESEKVPEDLQEYIKTVNRELNTELVKKTESGEEVTYDDIAKEAVYKVPRVYNLHNLPDNITLRVYDIPGLNDGKTTDLYFQYLDNNFHKFDIIIFVVDINSACNTDGEVRILQKIVQHTKRNREKYGIDNQLIVLANKCDDLHINDNGNAQIEDDELVEMYEQIKKEVATQVEKHNPNLQYKICPLSAEDSYIYRMYSRDPTCQLDIKHVNKFGMNEYGKSRWNRLTEVARHKKIQTLMSELDIAQTLKQTGFNSFSDIFKNCLSPGQQYQYICGHYLYNMRMYINECTENVNGTVVPIEKITFNDVTIDTNNVIGIENQFSSVAATPGALVAYGLKDKDGWAFRYVPSDGRLPINNNFFGDPLVGHCKHAYYATITNQSLLSSTPRYVQIKLKPCLDIYTDLVSVCKMYGDNSAMLKYYKFLDEVIALHRPQLILKEDDVTGLITETDLEHYEWAQKHCHKWQSEFGEEYHTLHDLYTQLTNMLNKYYETNINDQQKPVATLLQRFNKLCANGFSITRKLLGSLFTNNDMLNKKPDEIVELIKDMRTRNLMNKDQEINLCKDLLHRVYDNIYKGQQMGYINDDHIASYVYFADLFWHNSKLFKDEQTHVHINGHITYLAYRARQNMVGKINSGNRGLYPIGLELEKYLVNLLG